MRNTMPLIESLSAVIELPKNFDLKENYTDFLIDKLF